MGFMSIRLAHLSDTHLGYESYPVLSPNGNNQRGEDIVRAFRNVVRDVQAWDPDLVVHSGDVLERPKPDIRYMHFALRQLRELTVRVDGRRRPVVVLAGNHELSRSRREVCWLELLSGIPGVHVATRGYERVRFDADDYSNDALADVVVHAIPHDALRGLGESEVVPDDGMCNILTAHGVAGGSDLFYRALGREFAIPANILERDWSYGALGHWHKQGPITLEGSLVPNIWYAGSTENMGFRDLRDNGERRGYLRVVVGDDGPDVDAVHLPTRSMFRLPVVDAAGKTADDIVDEMLARVAGADIAGAVVGQVVTNVPRDLWSLVDVGRVRAAAGEALHFEVSTRYAVSEADSVVRSGGDAAEFTAAIATKLDGVPAPYHDPVTEKVTALINDQRDKFEEQT